MERRKKILSLPLRLSIVIVIIGALFKIMHWLGSNYLLLIGLVLIGIFYTLRFLNKKPKLKLDYIKLFLVLLWLTNYFIKVFHLYKVPLIIEIVLAIIFIWWFIEDGFFYIKNRKFKSKGIVKILYYILVITTIFSLFFGLLFKIQHWPYGPILFTIGILSLCLLLIFDYFVVEHT